IIFSLHSISFSPWWPTGQGPSGASGRRGLAGRGGVRGRRPAHPAQAEACVRPVGEERATHPAGMDGAKRGAGDLRILPRRRSCDQREGRRVRGAGEHVSGDNGVRRA
ncbi:unnamed protein product, partial [Urochloa humidicola]